MKKSTIGLMSALALTQACLNPHAEQRNIDRIQVIEEPCEPYEYGSTEPPARNPIPLCDDAGNGSYFDTSNGIWLADEQFQDLSRVPASFEYWVGKGTYHAPCCFDEDKGRPDCRIDIEAGENAELIGLRDVEPTYTPHPRVFLTQGDGPLVPAVGGA